MKTSSFKNRGILSLEILTLDPYDVINVEQIF